VGPDAADLAARLAEIHERLDYPPGVVAGVLALPILDPILDELEATTARDPLIELPSDVTAEIERLADVLLTGMLGTSPEAIQRRVRVLDVLRRADRGRLPARVADPGDPFGLELQAMLETDDGLRADLGALYPLIARATSVTPSPRWLREARNLLAAADRRALVAAVHRVLAALVRAEIVSRPDILAGGLRLANQRFARGLLWLVAAAGDDGIGTLEAVGLRMGTSGRSDAVVRDTALANTAAALLGDSMDPAAPSALASMRLEITNRTVLKQVDRALLAQAARAGLTVDDLVDSALPTFGLDPAGRLEIEAGDVTARIELSPAGVVEVLWLARGDATTAPPAELEAEAPGVIADVRSTVDRIAAAVAEERRRLEGRLASERSWSITRWRGRFGDHPVARVHARAQIWVVGTGREARAALPAGHGWVTVGEGPLAVADTDEVQLWHPADATPAEIAAWRATLASRNVTQAVRQADREVFAPLAAGRSAAADMRYSGRIVDHSRMRALLRQRGWAVPALGAWDQGDEATAWRDFDTGFRAELRYQAPDWTPTGERVTRARIVAVRFVRVDAGLPAGATEAVAVPLTSVPRRVFSEAIRDVSLALTI
jgi:hypothetical protein